MSILARYISWELLKTFVLSLVSMTVLVVMIFLVRDAMRQGLGPILVLRLIPYMLPEALSIAVPATILFAACSVYGRIASRNEIVALKSVGISSMAAIWPALILAFVISLVAVWLNDIARSWGKRGMHRVVLQSVEHVIYGTLRTHHSYQTDRFAIIVERMDSDRLINPMVTISQAGASQPLVLTANEAQLVFAPDADILRIKLTNSEIDFDRWEFDFPGELEYEIALSDASRIGAWAEAPANCPLRDVPLRLRRQEDEIRSVERESAMLAGYQLLTGDFNGLRDDNWKLREARLTGARYDLYRLHTIPWRRWANGLSCVFFVLVGVPLAIRLRTADVWTSFGLVFLPILLLYYPLLSFGSDRAKSGDWPAYSVWLGNAALLPIGIWLLRRVIRH